MHLNHWGRVTHICVGKLTIISSDNGLSPGRRQAIIWINTGILLIGRLGANFSEIYIEILTFSFKKVRLKMSSTKCRPFCLGFNVLSSQLNCWSLRCSWSIACRRCCNYIFILHLTPGFNILRKHNCKPKRETFKFLGFGARYIRDFTVYVFLLYDLKYCPGSNKLQWPSHNAMHLFCFRR